MQVAGATIAPRSIGYRPMALLLSYGGVGKMVARRGNAPRSAGCEPAALLLSYRAWKCWHPHPVTLRGLLVENQACCFCTMRAGNLAEHRGLAPRTPLPVRLLSRQLPRLAGRAPSEIGSPTWTRTTTNRLTGGHAPLTSSGTGGAPGRNCTCVVPFRRRMPVVCSATGAKMVARPGAAPGVSCSQSRRVC
jgi:hypothetical protein